MATFEPSPDLDPVVAQAIRQAMDALREELAPGAAATRPAPSARAASDRLQHLEEALSALDAATSQAELLAELLQQAGRFAQRAAFLVLDEGRYHGWAAYGFDADQDAVTAASVDGVAGAWGRVTGGAAASELGAADCAELVDQLGGAAASQGVLVGFSLRGSTAGALYADATTDDGLNPSALRILTYVATQALETLPLRRGAQAAVVAEPEPEPAADVDVDEMIQEVQSADTEQEILEIRREASAPPFDADLEVVEELAEEIEEEAEPPLAGFETVIAEPEPEAGFETVVPDEPEPPEPEIELPGVELPTFVDPAADTVETDSDAPEETQAEEPAEIAFATQDISTLDPAIGEPADEPAPKPRGLEPAEVAPPSDLDGPGWAFGGPATITDDTRHEEARRLARLLVTEIKLYNEEKVRDGRENGNLGDQLRDDLERSRRIYEERIDEEIRSETDYFQEECVRILAGGDSTALGA